MFTTNYQLLDLTHGPWPCFAPADPILSSCWKEKQTSNLPPNTNYSVALQKSSDDNEEDVMSLALL